MKKVVSILLIAAIGVFIFIALYFTDNGPLTFNAYGDVNMQGRVSQSFVDKNVTEKTTP